MPTVVITPLFARTIQHLQAPDGRLARVQYGRRGRDSVRFFLCTTAELRAISEHQIPLNIYEDLRKLKMVEPARNLFGWPIRKVYQLSDVGKAFKLPAEKFWVKETTE